MSSLLLELAEDLLSAFVNSELRAMDIVSSHFVGVGSQLPEAKRLLPPPFIDGSGGAPLYTSREHFVSAATQEYLFGALYEILVSALASEHGARLLATQSAERWLEQRVESLQRRLTVTRREASTQETIELSARPG